jgi:hypothetical protein
MTLLEMYPSMSIDLFASRTNYKLPSYVSRYSDHQAIAIDAFSIVWRNELYYILNLICGPCHLLPNPYTILTLPHKPHIQNPLKDETRVFCISGESWDHKEYLNGLEHSSLAHGEIPQNNSTTYILNNSDQ